MVKDPVCGMGVEEDDPGAWSVMVEGERFFFARRSDGSRRNEAWLT